MAKPAKTARAYDSPRRREQAAGTRELILTEAQRLFERDGYAATSMAAIAAAAGIALKTVYLSFDSKPGLLRAVWHRALRGDRDEVPVGEQDWFREAMAEPDPRRRLLLTAHNSRVVKQRAAAIMEVVRAAAPGDAQIGELWNRIQTDFHANQRTIVESLANDRALRPDFDLESAADTLFALNQPSLYHLLTTERGWSADRYEQWLGDLLASQLLTRGGVRTRRTQVASQSQKRH